MINPKFMENMKNQQIHFANNSIDINFNTIKMLILYQPGTATKLAIPFIPAIISRHLVLGDIRKLRKKKVWVFRSSTRVLSVPDLSGLR